MRASLFAVVGVVAGAFLGYMAGVLVFCMLLYPDSPQCGLIAVFVTAPGGAIAGAVAGAVLGLRKGK